MILERANTKPDVEFHYTPEELVKYCLSLLNFEKEDVVLDVGAGKNMVWYNNIKIAKKDFCEIELGKDFFEYKEDVDWCIGNPPFKFLWKMMEKSFEISNKGVAFLMAIDGINRFTPKRLEYIKSKGFYINKIAIVNCKKWFNSETHRRKVCDKCKEKSHKRKRKKYGTPTWKKIKQNADGRHYG